MESTNLSSCGLSLRHFPCFDFCNSDFAEARGVLRGFGFALTLSAFGLCSAGAVLTGPGGSSPPDTDDSCFHVFPPIAIPAQAGTHLFARRTERVRKKVLQLSKAFCSFISIDVWVPACAGMTGESGKAGMTSGGWR